MCLQSCPLNGVVECGNQPEFDFALRNMQITDNTSLNDLLWLCMPVSRSELLDTVRYRAGAPFPNRHPYPYRTPNLPPFP